MKYLCFKYNFNFIIHRMIAFLNFNAKVKFMKAGFINGVELCDLYVYVLIHLSYIP